jgi:hypothetical protein
MSNAPDPDFSQQARDAIKTALSQGAKATPDHMARIVVEQITSAARASQDQRRAVISACRAALEDLNLVGMDLSALTIQVLRGLSRISLMVRVDPQDVMTWVMEGVAEVAVTLGEDACERMAKAIEHEFIGAGPAFAELCGQARRRA